jgi:hypothetical protein
LGIDSQCLQVPFRPNENNLKLCSKFTKKLSLLTRIYSDIKLKLLGDAEKGRKEVKILSDYFLLKVRKRSPFQQHQK